ncbi:MAG: hypothetical protein IPK31_10985 [Chitinophagaceae bacterium]|nr:hypothetical protein [Chitinophagaceae bacterium]
MKKVKYFFFLLVAFVAVDTVFAQPNNFLTQPVKKVYRKFNNPLIKDTSITTSVINGQVFLDGDIDLGTVEIMDKYQFMQFSVVTDDNVISGRWTNGIVPFVIEPEFTFEEETVIINSLNHIVSRTNVCFVRRSGQGSFLRFKKYTVAQLGFSGGSSYLGKCNFCTNGQEVKLSSVSAGIVIHEVGHALGLLHEQSREDRDRFISIRMANVLPGMEGNFNKAIYTSTDIGAYDFLSIMHYFPTAFGKTLNGTVQQTIVKVSDPSDMNFGRANVLSAGDISGINSMYRLEQSCGTLSTTLKAGELAIGQSKTVTVSANKTHNLSSVFMRTGQEFEFTTANGSWKNGSTETNCAGYTGNIIDGARRYNAFNMFSLIGELFRENNTSNFLNVAFKIGCGRTYKATASGYLVTFANDILLGGYVDNSGSVTLTIKRVR